MTLPTRTPPVRPPAARTLVLGGARSGKSAEAERLLAAEPAVTYVATAGRREDDADWQARVAAHRARRPEAWRTLESTDLVPLLRDATQPVLVDCLTLWLTAVLDECGAWDGSSESAPPGVHSAVDARVEGLVAAWCAAPVPVVAVSNEVGWGVHPETASGRLFRDLMGRLNARVAAESEQVLLVVAGRVLAL
ncbi:MAG: bifunctional adenosylcobinamide kinase/adenosylcobinamide-phosphate guanylyltransferase [Actinomycetes bacterium]